MGRIRRKEQQIEDKDETQRQEQHEENHDRHFIWLTDNSRGKRNGKSSARYIQGKIKKPIYPLYVRSRSNLRGEISLYKRPENEDDIFANVIFS